MKSQKSKTKLICELALATRPGKPILASRRRTAALTIEKWTLEEHALDMKMACYGNTIECTKHGHGALERHLTPKCDERRTYS
jgi:hypothetical protein